MNTDTDFQKGFIAFELKGDLNTFESEFMDKVADVDCSDAEQRRNLLSSIWTLANMEWTKGYRQGNKVDSD